MKKRVVRVKGKMLTVVPRRMTKLFGSTYWVPNGTKGTIQVDQSLRTHSLLSTIVHEMVHQMDWRLSESRVRHLEYSLMHLVLSNPELFAELASLAPRKPRARRRH